MKWTKDKILWEVQEKIIAGKESDLNNEKIIYQKDFIKAWLFYPLIIIQKWEFEWISSLDDLAKIFGYTYKWYERGRFVSRETIDKYFRERISKHIKKQKMVSAQWLIKNKHSTWLNAVQKGVFWYKWLRDFANRNWFFPQRVSDKIQNIELYINTEIMPLCKKGYFIPERTLKTKFPYFYKMLVWKNIPWYNSYTDLVKKKWLKSRKVRKNNTEELKINFLEYFETKILPEAKKNKITAPYLAKFHWPWYSLFSKKIAPFPSWKEFKKNLEDKGIKL